MIHLLLDAINLILDHYGKLLDSFLQQMLT